MRIMVFDVPAESGGALTILKQYYDRAVEDKNNEWIFIISTPYLKETKNVKIIRYPWIKKSWMHRIFFDNFIAHKLVKKNNIDKILSLQNVIIPHIKVHQTVYVHNAIPFSAYKFRLNENKLLWIYQNIIGRSIFKSIKEANKVIVQTQWMKNKCIDKIGKNSDDIEVITPQIDIEIKNYFIEAKETLTTFFYPASAVEFKNHKIIVDACLELKKKNINNYNILFTLKGNENKSIEELYRCVKENKLPIEFIGYISKEKVMDFYSKSILLFPSYLETVGLPLIEAKLHNTYIIASDCEFSHEILDGYDKVYYFDYTNYNTLYMLLMKFIKKSNEFYS